MDEDMIQKQAETEHDNTCVYGKTCHMRQGHIESAFISRILRERLRESQKEAQQYYDELMDLESVAPTSDDVAYIKDRARAKGLHEAADIIHARIRDRERPFVVKTESGEVYSGDGPKWAIPDLKLMERIIRDRAYSVSDEQCSEIADVDYGVPIRCIQIGGHDGPCSAT